MILGIDIGGTKIAAGLVDDSGTIHRLTRRETPAANAEAIDAALVEVWRELAHKTEIRAVGLAVAGFVQDDRATVAFSPNIAWRSHPLASNFRRGAGLEVPVIVENDANAAAWAEHYDGAGRDSRTMVMLTVGTGLGGAVVIGGQLIRGSCGMAGEVAHMRVVPSGLLCGCGADGCWEQYASGSALVRSARNAIVREPHRARRLLDLAAGQPGGLSGAHVTCAAQMGDPLGVDLLAHLGRWLGVGAASLAAILDPDVIVVGGGVSAAGELLLQPARDAFMEHLPARFHRDPPALALARHANTAGMRGAALLAQEVVGASERFQPNQHTFATDRPARSCR